MKAVARSLDDGPHLAPSFDATKNVTGLPPAPDLEVEIDGMLADLKKCDLDRPDEVMRLCSGYMARCTEIYVRIIREEGRDRHLRWFRTQQLGKVMELIEFTYKAASRYVEIRRQDVEMSK